MFKADKTIKPYETRAAGFLGLSRLPVVEDGQLKVCKNMVFDQFPVMSVRNGRTLAGTVTGTPQAIIAAGDHFAVVAGNTLYYDGEAVSGLSLTAGPKSMVEFWGKIFIFPDAKYYDMTSGDFGPIGTGTYPENGSCPDMDYVCVHNNRIWGCKGNHIYASYQGNAMGTFTVTVNGEQEDRYGWTYFVNSNGDPSDVGAWAVDCAIDGNLTGIFSWDNRVICLGNRSHMEVYGDYPSNFSLRSISKYGTVNHASMQEVNSRLYYVSRSGVLQYSGGLEKDVARDLNETYTDAVAGTDGTRYYLSLKDGDRYKLYVYHTLFDCWTEEDSPDIVDFAQMDGAVYGLCADGNIYRLNDPESTERVSWRFEFDDYSSTVYSNTMIQSLHLKVKSAANAYMDVDVAVDGGDSKTKRSLTFPNHTLQTVDVGFCRGVEHRFIVKGEGPVEIYGYQYTFVNGGDRQ